MAAPWSAVNVAEGKWVGLRLALSATFTVACAVSPEAVAVTFTAPNVVPVGVNTPLPAPMLAMSSWSTVQLAETVPVVLLA